MKRAELDRLGIDPEHVRAWYSSKEDAVYVNAARVRASEVPYLLLHEAAVHKGLPAVLGDQYDPVMDSIYGQYREEIEALNELYHYDLENEGERLRCCIGIGCADHCGGGVEGESEGCAGRGKEGNVRLADRDPGHYG